MDSIFVVEIKHLDKNINVYKFIFRFSWHVFVCIAQGLFLGECTLCVQKGGGGGRQERPEACIKTAVHRGGCRQAGIFVEVFQIVFK